MDGGRFSDDRRVRSRACAREDLRPQLRLAVILQVLQQAVGINAVMYYGATIIQAAGVSGAAAAVHLALAVAATSALGSVLGLLAVDACGRRRLLLASLLGCVVALAALTFCFLDVERGPSSPVSEIATGTCAAAATCRECLAASCGFCAAGGCRGTRGAWWAQPRDRTARGTEENARRPSRYDARTRHPEDTIAAPPPPPPPTLDEFDLEADAASFEDFWPPRGMRYHPRRPPDRASRETPRASEHRHLRRQLAVSLVSFAARSPRARRADAVRDVVSGGMSPVPWVVAAEIFPTGARGPRGVAASANWAANLVVSTTFPGCSRRSEDRARSPSFSCSLSARRRTCSRRCRRRGTRRRRRWRRACERGGVRGRAGFGRAGTRRETRSPANGREEGERAGRSREKLRAR